MCQFPTAFDEAKAKLKERTVGTVIAIDQALVRGMGNFATECQGPEQGATSSEQQATKPFWMAEASETEAEAAPCDIGKERFNPKAPGINAESDIEMSAIANQIERFVFAFFPGSEHE